MYAVAIGMTSFVIPMTFLRVGYLSYLANVVISMLFPNWAFANGMLHLMDFECDGNNDVVLHNGRCQLCTQMDSISHTAKGLTWTNMYSPDHTAEEMSFGLSWFFLLGSAGVYQLLAVYLDLTSQVKMFPPAFKWYNFAAVKMRNFFCASQTILSLTL